MKFQRRKILAGMSVYPLTALVGPSLAQQASFPVKPITLVIPTPPGGLLDSLARFVGKNVGDSIGQPIIVESRPGASTMVASEYVARAQPDGYTLLLNFTALILNPLLYTDGRVRYDPFKDFVPVSQLAASNNVVFAARPDPRINTLTDFIALAKSSKDPLTYSTIGIGNPTHFYGEMFAKQAGIKLSMIPYKGESAQLPDLLTGRTDAAFLTVGTADQHKGRNKMRVLAVTGKKRSEYFPEVPTFKEQGIANLDDYGWYGVFAPRNTPAPIVEKLAMEFQRAVQLIKPQVAALGLEAVSGTPAQFSATVKTSNENWVRMVKEIGIRPE